MRTHATVFPSITETMMSKGEEVAMRIKKAFLSVAVAAAGLLAAPAVMAAGLPTSCPAGPWTVTLISGPTVETCQSGPCVTFTYEVTGSTAPDHVAGLMPVELSNVTGPSPTGNQVYGVGVGDPVFNLGISDVSRKAFKVNPNATVVDYKVWLNGTSFSLGLVPVKIKKGTKGSYVDGACALAGPAVAEVAPNPLATFTEDVVETLGGKCKVKAHTNKSTGVTTVTLVQLGSDPACVVYPPIPIQNVTVQVGADQLGPVEFSERFSFLVGIGTCAYKQYYEPNGNVYKVCW